MPTYPFRAATSRPVSVTKTALVRIDHNRYSVPAVHAGRILRAEVYADKVEIYADAALVATHSRSYRRDESFLELAHHVPAFQRKPRAAGCCAALHQADPVFLRARDLLLREPGGYRLFAEILMLGMRFDLEVLAQALGECLACGRLSVEGCAWRLDGLRSCPTDWLTRTTRGHPDLLSESCTSLMLVTDRSVTRPVFEDNDP